MTGRGSPPDRNTVLQEIIVDLLDEHGGQPEPVVHQHLRTRIRRRGLLLPPEFWLATVAGEISADRLYVVANGAVAQDYRNRPSGRRAAERVAGNDSEPGAGSADQSGG